jgi:hypothetical protein
MLYENHMLTGVKKLSEGRNKVVFDSRHEHPTTSKSDENFGKRRTLARNGGRMTVRIIVEKLNVSREST